MSTRRPRRTASDRDSTTPSAMSSSTRGARSSSTCVTSCAMHQANQVGMLPSQFPGQALWRANTPRTGTPNPDHQDLTMICPADMGGFHHVPRLKVSCGLRDNREGDMQERPPITRDMRVAALLRAYPETEELLIGLAPAFEKLRNPMLRRSVARVATLAQAAAVERVSPATLVNTLRTAVG